ETYDWAVQFGGLIYIPVFTQQGSSDKGVTEADALFYEATIDPENGYLFTTGPATEMEMDLWLAQATILPSSTFSMGYSIKDEAIITRAVINANIGIGGSLGEKLEVNLPELGVRQLTVQNIGTPIALNTSQWELSSSGPVNVGVFEFGINPGDTSTLSSATDSSLPQPSSRIDIKSYVKLTKTEGLTGQGGFSVEGEMVRNGELDQWVNKDFRLKDVYVQGRNVIPGIKYLEGSLGFYEEVPEYGTGFRGALTVEMQSVLDQVRMVAQFGTYENRGDYKDYYFIDASATFADGAPLGGAIYLRGIGGGFYRNMIRPEGIEAFSQIKLDPITPTFLNSAIGESLSGVRYRVDNSAESFGFKALTILSSPPVGQRAGELNGESTLFNANLELGMNFKKTHGSDGYGLQMIYFQGLGRFMGDIDLGTKIKQIVSEGTIGEISGISQDHLDFNPSTDRPKGSELPVPDAAVSAQVLMQIKLDCPEVHGLLGVYLNAGILYGSAFADMLIRRGCNQEGSDLGIRWHVFLGSLEQPILLGINVPILGELLTIKSYLMAGNEGIPTSLPPPMDYVSIFDQELLNEKYGGYPGGPYPNPAPANRGSGFATGMALKVGTPPEGLKFLFMYATLQGGLGFDVMLANNIISECYESVGINGWYGRGQAWLYANAEIGAIVKLGFLEFRIKAFQAAAGAMLRVEGPNPFYGTGRLDAKLNLLGLVNAGLKFKVTVGSSIEDALPDDCAPPVSPLDMPIIQDVYPLLPGSAGQYPANTSFIVELSYQLDQIITDPENPNKKYRIALPMDKNITYSHTTEPGGDIVLVIDDDEQPQGGSSPVITTLEFPTWFSIKDESLKDIPYTYRLYPNAFGGTNILVTPSELLTGNESVIIRPKAFILNAIPIGGGYQYNIEQGYIEDPVYTFRILPRIEDYIIHESEVLYSYPLREMDHFLRGETASMNITESSIKPAYWITLNKSKPFIFENIPDGLDIKGRMIDEVGNQVGGFMDVDRAKNGKQETYIFSKNNSIKNDENYQLELVYLKGSDVEMILYQLPFKVSQFNTMGEKLNTYQLSSYQYIDLDGDPYCQDDEMNFVFRGQEGMGEIELNNDVIQAMYRRGACEGMGWITDHNASCNIYKSYDFISGLINHDDHPAYSIELTDGGENEFILKSQLPAIIFDLNNLLYQISDCGGDGGSELPKGLINLLCSPDYTFPGNASGSFFSIVKYRVLLNGKEYANEYDFQLNTIDP
ncbi:MAG: hypothetical protein HKN68_08360, partial [Saprospiraceae bacterium]|nr:hypothetical protein [Saprospiraceae bacterium]